MTTTSGHRNYTNDDLYVINNEKALTLLPAMIYLGILMIFGIVGNSLACYIFCCRLKSGTQNFLIVCLAVFDLLSCVLSIPYEITDMRFYFDFTSVEICKIMRFVNTFCSIGSIFTLLVIAIDRYRKICKPFHGQISMTHVRLSLIPIVGGAILFSWPAFIMYGLRTTETEIPGLFGKDCSTPDNMSDTEYPLLYNCILFLCFIILAVALIVIYTFVLRETNRHNHYMKRNSDYNINSSGQYYSEEVHSGMDVPPGHDPSLGSGNAITKTAGNAYGSNATVQTILEAPVTETQLNSVNGASLSLDNAMTKTSLSAHGSDSAQTTIESPVIETQLNSVNGASLSLDNAMTKTSLSANGSDTAQTTIESPVIEIQLNNANGALLSSNKATTKTLVNANGSNSTVQTIIEEPVSETQTHTLNNVMGEIPPKEYTQKDIKKAADQTPSSNNSEAIATTVSFADSPSQSEQIETEKPRPPHELTKRSSLSSANGDKKSDFRKLIFVDSTAITQQQSSAKKQRRIKSKTTMIAFLVTVVFIVSFLPHLTLQVTKMLYKGFDTNLEDSGLVAYNIFLRSYFINSVSNPIIYGALNVQFGKEVKLLARKLCRKSS